MTKPKHQDIDIILIVIVIISILITTLLDAIQCLTSLNFASSTPPLGKQDLQSNGIKSTKSGSTKTQRLSPSTKPRLTTAVQKKVAGGTKQDTQSSPTASSPRSKQSKPSSNTSKSTRSQSSQALVTQRRTRTTKSTLATDTLLSTPKPNHTTADDTHSHTTRRSEHQPTEPLHLLPKPQEEVQEHTVLRTKVSRSKLKG